MTKTEMNELMAMIRSKRTTPEMLVHGLLKGKKVQHVMWPDWIDGHPDVWIRPLEFASRETVVFVNGCYWHGCPRHFRLPKTNRGFWARKIRRNIERQRSVARRLRSRGYSVRTLWEHDLVGRGVDNGRVSRRVMSVVK